MTIMISHTHMAKSNPCRGTDIFIQTVLLDKELVLTAVVH